MNAGFPSNVSITFLVFVPAASHKKTRSTPEKKMHTPVKQPTHRSVTPHLLYRAFSVGHLIKASLPRVQPYRPNVTTVCELLGCNKHQNFFCEWVCFECTR